mgnify:CR=1 FL=1|jgi:hypothetical protein
MLKTPVLTVANTSVFVFFDSLSRMKAKYKLNSIIFVDLGIN